ncbi:hypothetical protein ACWEN6_12530 [Sphaerisporangium sp. NPDC004334]
MSQGRHDGQAATVDGFETEFEHARLLRSVVGDFVVCVNKQI